MTNHRNSQTPGTSLTRRIIAGGLLSTLAIGAVGVGTASAETGDGAKLTAARTKCIAGIDRRIEALESTSAKLSADKYLTDAHRSTLAGEVSTTLDGVKALRPQVEADTKAADLRTHCTAVVKDYRVFAVVLPKVHLTRGADAASAAAARATEVQPKIDAAIEAATEAGKDTTTVEADQAALSAALDKLSGDVEGLADSVLGVTPADFNADNGVLDAAKASGKAARADGKAVREAAKKLRTDLKALRG